MTSGTVGYLLVAATLAFTGIALYLYIDSGLDEGPGGIVTAALAAVLAWVGILCGACAFFVAKRSLVLRIIIAIALAAALYVGLHVPHVFS